MGKILVNKKGEAIISAPSPVALLLLMNGEVQVEIGIAPNA